MKVVYGDVTKDKAGIADGVVYKISSKSELDKVRQLNSGVLKNVASKFILADEVQDAESDIAVFGAELGFTVFDEAEKIPDEIHKDAVKMHLLLKQVFRKIDSDNSGFIDVKELAKASTELGGDTS
jgi:hypothetical protein